MLDGKGGFYVVFEGCIECVILYVIYYVFVEGEIKNCKGEIGLFVELMVVEKCFGFEGIICVGDILWMLVQCEWKDDLKNYVKLVVYNFKIKEWGVVYYEKVEFVKGWVGLLEIIVYGDYVYIIECDNQYDVCVVIKKIYCVVLFEMVLVFLGGELLVVKKELVCDLILDLILIGGYVLDKVEGFVIFEDGIVIFLMDNDGVDDYFGEMIFMNIGNIESCNF